MRPWRRRWMLGLVAIMAVAVLNACGEGVVGEQPGQFSAATGEMARGADLFLTEADAGKTIEAPTFQADIGLLDKKGVILTLEGDDASTLRWRFGTKPDPFLVDWYKVNDQLAFETGDLIGDPAVATKVLEFRPAVVGDTTFVLELVERDPANRTTEPAKRLEYIFSVCYEPDYSGGGTIQEIPSGCFLEPA